LNKKEPENHLATPTLAETEPVNEKEPEKEKEPGNHVATPTLSYSDRDYQKITYYGKDHGEREHKRWG
jgi:hypothetical protein